MAQKQTPNGKTEAERLYDLIYAESVKGFRFTDETFGIPWIEAGDIEDFGEGLYVISFRCTVGMMHDVHFVAMAKDVCAKLGCRLEYYHNVKYENKLPYEDCVWVIDTERKG